MIDFSTAVETSFASMSHAPKFVPGIMAPRDDQEVSEQQFIGDMEARFQQYQTDIAIWAETVQTNRIQAETGFRSLGIALDDIDIVRIQLLVDDLAERVESDIAYTSKRLKQMQKLGRKMKKISAGSGDFIINLTARIRAVHGVEIDELIMEIDWWRAIVATYDPRNARSEVFDDPDDLLAHLKSA